MNSSQITFGKRLRKFREGNHLSQQDLANRLGVGKITVLRWENGTSRPSPLAADKLQGLGFGMISGGETKQVSIPRLTLQPNNHRELRDSIRKRIQVGTKAYSFDPSPYVFNGPADQLPFFETLYGLQDCTSLPCSPVEYIKRLSLIATVPGLGSLSAQYELEGPGRNAKHWNPNYGSHGWHRYVGRFPPHVVRILLNHFGAKRGETVCDPFAGSGTALVESRLLGLKAIGIEICPLSALISRTKSKFPASSISLQNVTESLSSFYRSRWDKFAGQTDVSRISYEEILQREGNFIEAFSNRDKWLTPEAFLGTSIVVEFAKTLKGFERDAVCCALSSRMRSIGNVDVDVVRAEYSKTPRIQVDVLRHVERAIGKMILDIERMAASHASLLSTPDDIQVVEQSVLDARFAPESIDYIITSPPYGVESLSYLRTHLLSYRCLHPILHYDPYTFDAKAIGSEYVSENGTTEVRSIAAPISNSYAETFDDQRFPVNSEKLRRRKDMMMRFFDDIVEVARLFSIWLRPDGRVAFIIGNKRIGDDVIPTDRIITEIFKAFKFRLDGDVNHKLKCNNSNSEVPWQERTIQDEHILLFTKKA